MIEQISSLELEIVQERTQLEAEISTLKQSLSQNQQQYSDLDSENESSIVLPRSLNL